MKKIIKIVLFVVLILFMGYMLNGIIKKIKQKKIIAEQIQSIPQFSFINVLNQHVYTNDSIESNKACLIVYYNSECDHCQYEAEQIGKHIERFKDYQILMISFDSINNVLLFKEKYKLDSQVITFLQDSKYQFDDIFGNSPIPTSFIYNKDKKLVKQFNGEVRIEALLKYLAE